MANLDIGTVAQCSHMALFTRPPSPCGHSHDETSDDIGASCAYCLFVIAKKLQSDIQTWHNTSVSVKDSHGEDSDEYKKAFAHVLSGLRLLLTLGYTISTMYDSNP